MATKVNQEPLEPWTRESNQVAIAHLHTTLNKSRDEKLNNTLIQLLSHAGTQTVIWVKKTIL